ncbi:MAG: hypothetical protein A2X22_09455 [Bacteroidetes bacterium GWF2_49_14]|nr:MAG: hypothetical protein A2X22_09455 [Bacteroidetes bacterium GWF2_49_14]HBB93101.1 hypothetical protein [Bacteroidales bacterium]
MTFRAILSSIVFLRIHLNDVLSFPGCIQGVAFCAKLPSGRLKRKRIRIIRMNQSGTMTGFAGNRLVVVGCFNSHQIIMTIIADLLTCIFWLLILILNKGEPPVVSVLTERFGYQKITGHEEKPDKYGEE